MGASVALIHRPCSAQWWVCTRLPRRHVTSEFLLPRCRHMTCQCMCRWSEFARDGAPWNLDEESWLWQHVVLGTPAAWLAMQLSRTPSAVKARIKQRRTPRKAGIKRTATGTAAAGTALLAQPGAAKRPQQSTASSAHGQQAIAAAQSKSNESQHDAIAGAQLFAGKQHAAQWHNMGGDAYACARKSSSSSLCGCSSDANTLPPATSEQSEPPERY